MPKSLFALLPHIDYADAKLKRTNIYLEMISCWQELKATCRPSAYSRSVFLLGFIVYVERITVKKCSEGAHGGEFV